MKRTEVSAEKREEILRQLVATHKQAAILGGIGETALRKAMSRGEVDLPVIRVGSRCLIPMSAIRRWLSIDS